MLIALALVLLSLALLLFFLLPAMLLAECAARAKTPGSKAAWIAFSIFLFPVVPLIYGALLSKRVLLRVFSFLAIAAGVAIIAIIVTAIPLVFDLLQSDIANKIKDAQQTPGAAPSAQTLAEVENALNYLANERKSSSWHDFPGLGDRILLWGYLEELLADGDLTEEEAEDWLSKFSAHEAALQGSTS
jgi:hypothetical protein